MSAEQVASVCIRAYARLASAFPEEFQRVCGSEMVDISTDMIRDAATRRGWVGLLPLTLRLFIDLLMRLAVEYTNELAADIRYAARMLWASPGFAFVSIASLSIGIGMTTVVYSQLKTTVFENVRGVSRPHELVVTRARVSYPTYQAFRNDSGQFAQIAAYVAPVPFSIGEKGRTERIWGHLVTPDYFDVLGVHPHRGNFIGANDSKREAAPAAVISYRLWTNKFDSDPGIIGRSLRINGVSVTVNGIAPDQFLGASPMVASADIWIPATAQSRVAPELGRGTLEDRRIATFSVVGRLTPGISQAQAQTALDTMVRRLEQIHNDPGRDNKAARVQLVQGGRVVPINDSDLPVVTAFPAILCGLILWIASANVATMFLVRASRRRKEISIRLAMGASRSRIVRHLLTESILLGILGGIGGLLFTIWTISTSDSIRVVYPVYSEMHLEMDLGAFLINTAISVFVGILFGLAPALQASGINLAPAMKEGAHPPLRGYRWFSGRNLLVLQQVAGSLALLLITGYIVIGFQRSGSADLGFDPKPITTMSIDPVREGYTAEQATALLTELPTRLRRVPGITAASLTQSEPLAMFSGDFMETKISAGVAGQMTHADRTRIARVGAGFFETLDLPIRRGRAFVEDDQNKRRAVIVVNETLAKENWPNQDPLGRTIELDGRPHEVIGVAKDVRSGFGVDFIRRGIYRPIETDRFATPSLNGVFLAIRTQPGTDAAGLVRRELARIDPNLTVFNVRTVSESVRQMAYITQLAIFLYGGIGVFGLILAAIGLAGVTAYAVAQRTREIAIRVALGARRADVLKLVMREGIALVIIGLVLGQAAAFGVTRALTALVATLADVMNTSTSDPLLVFGAPLLLGLLTLAACYFPARRSMRIQPTIALRND